MDLDLPGQSLAETLERRRSVRRFRADPVEREVVERLVAAACRAPSAHNAQPWQFVVAQSADARGRLVRSMGSRLERDLRADGRPPGEVELFLARAPERLLNAPVAVVICLEAPCPAPRPDERRRRVERLLAAQDVA